MALSTTNWLTDPKSQPYQADVYADAAANGISPDVLGQYLENESGFNATAQNPASSAYGIGQILSSTAADPGYGIAPVNPADPNASISFIAQYIAQRGISGTSGTYDQTQLLSAAGISSPMSSDGTVGAATGTTAAASGQPATAASSGSWGLAQYFEAAIVVILGFVFVAVGLTYFSHPSGGVASAVRSTGRKAAEAVAV